MTRFIDHFLNVFYILQHSFSIFNYCILHIITVILQYHYLIIFKWQPKLILNNFNPNNYINLDKASKQKSTLSISLWVSSDMPPISSKKEDEPLEQQINSRKISNSSFHYPMRYILKELWTMLETYLIN